MHWRGSWVRLITSVTIMSFLLIPGQSMAQGPRGAEPQGLELRGDNLRLTTDAEESKRHAAYIQQQLQMMSMDAVRPIPENTVLRGDPVMEGDCRILAERFTSGSGKIAVDSKYGILDAVRFVSLKIIGVISATVGEIISDIQEFYKLRANGEKEVTAETFRKYAYWQKDGQYYKRGSWRTAISVEKRVVYYMGWASFWTADGSPVEKMTNKGTFEWVMDQPNCKYYDNSWILKQVDLTYQGKQSQAFLSWDRCYK